ncbi:MAG: hypothetical protein JST00_43005, partial [Deltaproteobacteria bacterium]|nr:hypothetical protein [Deltaproteobacteria bacterium]
VDAIVGGGGLDGGASEGGDASAVDAGATPTDAGAEGGAGPDAGATCITASNAAHVAAGRARAYFGFAYAAGSGQALGFASALVRTTLKPAGAGRYVLGACDL